MRRRGAAAHPTQLQELCPRHAIGAPEVRVARGCHRPSIRLRAPLEFKNPPGEPSRRPYFNSPYHYRLDWETWIHVTASMEHVMTTGYPPLRSLSI